VAGGEFSRDQQVRIDRAMRDAEQACRWEFSVYVGPAQGPSRPYAHTLHAALTAPARSVLLLVDPAARMLEIVTGSELRRSLPDDVVRGVAAEMEADFASGELVDGIVRGVGRLADAARTRPPSQAELPQA
jgi:hypothetical protein